MLKKTAAVILTTGTVLTSVNTAHANTADIVIRAGEYENKPGKRVYVDANFETPDDIPLRRDEHGYYISEWDINVKLSKRIVYYLQEYDVNVDLQTAHRKSEDLNAAGRIAKAKNPVVYFSVHHNYYNEDSSGYFMMVNTKAIYKVGEGILQHSKNGFVLDGCDGKLHYEQKPKSSYSLYSDYYWYEIGDVICIGDMKTLYYCFPKTDNDVVAKTRIATEEIFKLS
jgi:N-acetylmuramoyl-L-alanine amidase